MEQPLHILFVEDSVSDMELMESKLVQAGFEIISQRVETRPAFLQKLTEFSSDLVLAECARGDTSRTESRICGLAFLPVWFPRHQNHTLPCQSKAAVHLW